MSFLQRDLWDEASSLTPVGENGKEVWLTIDAAGEVVDEPGVNGAQHAAPSHLGLTHCRHVVVQPGPFESREVCAHGQASLSPVVIL